MSIRSMRVEGRSVILSKAKRRASSARVRHCRTQGDIEAGWELGDREEERKEGKLVELALTHF